MTQSSVWQVEWTRAAESDLARLDPPIARRVVQAVLRFAATGQGDVRALSGQLGGYRLRVGSWRVRFVSDRSIRTICVLRVLHRREAYDHP